MSDQNHIFEEQVEQSFAKVLNRHGYGFHYSVIRAAHNLGMQGKSGWLFEAVEFPVEVQGTGTRIDFVLRRSGRRAQPLYLLAECKRANPALSNWCFVRAPYVHRERHGEHEPLIIERAERTNNGRIHAFAKQHSTARNPYHIAVEVRSNVKGDKDGESGQAIEQAASQVSRGLNGFIQTVAKNVQVLGEYNGANFLPVIFTTAQLWGSNVNLASADLETGVIDLTSSEFVKLPWLCHQYHLSPGLKHSWSPTERPAEIGTLMQTEYIRTIPIVSPSGLESFLGWSTGLDLDD